MVFDNIFCSFGSVFTDIMMQIKIYQLPLLLLLASLGVQAQAPNIALNDDYYHLIERFQISRGKLSENIHTNVKPYDRRSTMSLVDSVVADRTFPLNFVDFYNLDYLRADSWEWSADQTPESRKPLLRNFYRKPSDFYHIHNKLVDLHLSPVMDLTYGSEVDHSIGMTSRGVEIRGMIANKVGFYTFVTDNQSIFPDYVGNYTNDLVTVRPTFTSWNTPGETLSKKALDSKRGADFFSARGYITFNPVKQINVQFGHDRNFYGNGFRSMLLSDFSTPYLFLKISTQLGRFNYTQLLCNTLNNQIDTPFDKVIDKKYMAIHNLSINLTKNINVSVFEAEVFNRDANSGFDFNYLNPIIFYRYVESYLGSGDNAMLGFDVKYNFLKRFSFYSQLVLDEFKTASYFSENGSWVKKYGFQAGLKYINAFGIRNLDLQGEYNMARPYTYSHKSGFTNYAHNSQSLAHPLGANFSETVFIARYQPFPRLTFYGTLMNADQGVDADGKNWGGNILKNYISRVSELNNTTGQGVAVKTSFIDFRASYMMRHNFFVDARLLVRKQESPNKALNANTTVASLGFRLNMAFRQQVF
jgi:hypothetical protein